MKSLETACHRERRQQGKWLYRTCMSMEEALTGADFVVISILPGTFDEMAVDVHMPERWAYTSP